MRGGEVKGGNEEMEEEEEEEEAEEGGVYTPKLAELYEESRSELRL